MCRILFLHGDGEQVLDALGSGPEAETLQQLTCVVEVDRWLARSGHRATSASAALEADRPLLGLHCRDLLQAQSHLVEWR